MNWIEVSIDTAPERLDELCLRLSALGYDNLQIEDGREMARSLAEKEWELSDPSFVEELRARHRVLLYLPDENGLPDIRSVLCPETDRLSTRLIAEESWAESWKQFYKPRPIGNRLLIQPAWLPVDNPEGRAVFFNNPGMSFGTGEHETTRLCLQALDRYVEGKTGVLDIGCGSGILFICALLLGAVWADAIEIDPFAAEIADQNARQNGLNGRYRVFTGNLLAEPVLEASARYDIVVTNIVADVVMALIPAVDRHLTPDGRWLVSGVIDTRRDDVVEAAGRAGFSLEQEMTERGWHCFVFVRR